MTFSTGDYLDAGRMRSLMLELRKMNYSVDATHMLVVSWDTEHTIHAERQEGQQHSQDDYVGMGLWFSERSQNGYYSNLNFDLDAESVENTLNVDLWVD